MVVAVSRSIDLSFLSRHAKDLPLPELVYHHDDEGRYGFYLPPFTRRWQIGDRDYAGKNGVIVVTTPELVQATLAHEWRHHWQFHNKSRAFLHKLGTFGGFDINSEDESDMGIRCYFRSSPMEFDALRYEVRRTPNEENLEWLNWAIIP